MKIVEFSEVITPSSGATLTLVDPGNRVRTGTHPRRHSHVMRKGVSIKEIKVVFITTEVLITVIESVCFPADKLQFSVQTQNKNENNRILEHYHEVSKD